MASPNVKSLKTRLSAEQGRNAQGRNAQGRNAQARKRASSEPPSGTYYTNPHVRKILRRNVEARIAAVEAAARIAAAEAAAKAAAKAAAEAAAWKEYLKQVIIPIIIKMAENPLKVTAKDHLDLENVGLERLEALCVQILRSLPSNGGVPPWCCWAPIKNTGAPLRIHMLVAIFAKIYFPVDGWPDYVSEELREACVRMLAAEPSDDDSLCSEDEFTDYEPEDD